MFSEKKITKLEKSSKTSQYTGSLRYALLLVGVWCASLLVSIGMLVPQQVYAKSLASIPGGNVSSPAIRAVDIAKPAVVRIWTAVNGHLSVHFPPTTDVSFPQKANGNYPLAFSGTGTFISSQGDILTADHVVQPPKSGVLDPALYQSAAQDVANYINQNAKAGSTPVSASDVTQQLTSGQLQSKTTYDPATSRVFMSTDYAGTYTATDLNSIPSTLMATVDTIKASSPTDQQDVAIVHVPMNDTPSVTLGNSSNVQQQDQLTVIGFPGNADVSQKPQDFLSSSISSVYVSSKKTSDSGAPLIQIGGNIDHGDSGGPALDSQGTVVGVVSFGISSQGSNSVGGTSFLQASSSALKLAQSINLNMSSGSFQNQWSQAFNDYASTLPGHWHKAVQGFTQLAHSYPQFQAIQPFLTYAQTQAQTEPIAGATPTPTPVQHKGSTPTPTTQSSSLAPWQAWALAIGAVVLLFALALSLFVVAIRRKRRQSSKLTPAPTTRRGKAAQTIAAPKPSEPVTTHDQTGNTIRPDRAAGDIAATSATPVAPRPAQSDINSGQNTLSLKVWPCGHMNRSNARFCSICGEPAPD